MQDRCSTRWTWSARRASRSRRRPCAWSTRPTTARSTSSTSSTRPATWTSPTRSRRSLAACEGALLVVDAAQGIEAQTLANVYLALEQDLAIIPVINKIDLPMRAAGARGAGDGDGHRHLARGRDAVHVGEGGDRASREVLEAVVRRIPPPHGERRRARCGRSSSTPTTTPYKGVVAYVRVVDGALPRTGASADGARRQREVEIAGGGHLPARADAGPTSSPRARWATSPRPQERQRRARWATRSPTRTRRRRAAARLPPAKPMVFAGSLSRRRRGLPAPARRPREAELNDAALTFEPESSRRPGLRLPLRLPRPAPHGDHPGAPGARVRPRRCWPRAERGVPGDARPTAASWSSTTRRDLPRRARSTTSRSHG